MIPINRILCPVDFSDTARHALHHAVALAKWYHAELMLLYVHHLSAVPAGPTEVMPVMVMTPAEREQLLASLRTLVATEIGESVVSRVDVLEGSPAHEIVERANKTSADLIVMGTHGASGFERLVMGSVTEKVMRKALCPVMTVPPRAPDWAPVPPLFKRILCAVDFSDCSMRALKYATSLAMEADACLTVVHIFEVEGALPETWSETLTPRSMRDELIAMERERSEKLAYAVPESARAFCRVETTMASGTPYREILRIARDRRSELIVLGIHGRNAADLLFFGSTANHVVRRAVCPVLTIRS
jgi:nucleotide-binding universal stress UspA family protein